MNENLEKEREAIKLLQEYADLEGTELGEACNLLISLHGYYYCLSDDLNKLISKEIHKHLNYFLENSIIEKKEITEKRITEYLIWTDE